MQNCYSPIPENQFFQGYPGYSGYPVSTGYPEYYGYQGCPGDYSPCCGMQPLEQALPVVPSCGNPTAQSCAEPLPQPCACSKISGQYCNPELTRIIQDCQATCEYATTHIKGKSDCTSRRNQLIILRDCADICSLNGRFIPRGADCDKQSAALCAKICECCAKECAKFCDRLSQQCAEVCYCCAKACRAFAGQRC